MMAFGGCTGDRAFIFGSQSIIREEVLWLKLEGGEPPGHYALIRNYPPITHCH